MINKKTAVILIASRKPKTYASRALGCPPTNSREFPGLAQAYSSFAWAGSAQL
jgi:hypothetical protein